MWRQAIQEAILNSANRDSSTEVPQVCNGLSPFFFYSDVELNNVVMVEKEDVLFRYGVLLPFRYPAGYCCTFKSGFQFTWFWRITEINDFFFSLDQFKMNSSHLGRCTLYCKFVNGRNCGHYLARDVMHMKLF